MVFFKVRYGVLSAHNHNLHKQKNLRKYHYAKLQLHIKHIDNFILSCSSFYPKTQLPTKFIQNNNSIDFSEMSQPSNHLIHWRLWCLIKMQSLNTTVLCVDIKLKSMSAHTKNMMRFVWNSETQQPRLGKLRKRCTTGNVRAKFRLLNQEGLCFSENAS